MFRKSNAMKQKATTIKFKQSFLAIALVAVVGLVAAPFTVFANNYQAEINELDKQIEAAQAEAHRLEGEANTLQNKLNILAIEKSAIQKKIDRNESKRKKLLDDIKVTEEKIKKQQKVLGDTLGDLYVDKSITPIEMLASSKTIGDYIDQQSYRSSIRDGLQSSIKEIKKLRTTLNNQKKEVETVLAEQKGQRDQLAAKQREQNNLLALTRNKEASYQALVGELQKKKEAAEAALAASLSTGSYKVAAVGPVGAGEVVGSVGNTGLSTGAHLHLEVRDGGGSVTDPSPYIRRDPIVMPPGVVSQPYGNPDPIYRSGYHPGTDYATGEGAPIFAIDGGYMYRGCSDTMLGTSDNAYGYVAIVEHSNGMKSVYAHMSGGPSACNYNTYY